MRVFLAGASGVVGRRVVPELLAHGHAVVGLARGAASADRITALGATAVLGDVYDAPGLAEIVRAAAPDVVMHQLTDLGAGDRVANARVRTVGTRNLVDAAKAAGVRRMVAQSISWAYEPGDAPATEDTPLDLTGTAERLATVSGVAALEAAVAELPEWVILRYGTLYGPDTWYAPDGLMTRLAQAGTLPATADVTSFLHVTDAATAAVDALTWPPGPTNLCDDDPTPSHEWTPAFCMRVGAPPPTHSDAARTPWARGADNTHARKDLGWTPAHPSWREGFARG
ncbi:NAD-dependent epimerase/dehydratase family protein [Amycolatopsis sp. NPDC004368]